uniref:Uncharacterized protein n=1 Tax=Arundo donax TaxID=35708 RepID=A0A0A8YT55_ARUDO
MRPVKEKVTDTECVLPRLLDAVLPQDFVNDVRCGYDPPARRNSTNHRQSADNYWVRPHVIRDLISYDRKTGFVKLTTEMKALLLY